MGLMHDNLRIGEELYANGRLVAESNMHEVIGEVEVIYTSKHGHKTVFTRTLHRNDLLVTGAVFLSEKVNNVRSSFKTTPLDLEIGVHKATEIDTSSSKVPSEYILGFMVGNGGCGDTYNTVHKVHRTDRSVPGYLPFRVVPINEDLKGDERAKYFLRVEKGLYAYYYGKTFAVNREINVQYEDGTIVPTNVDVIGDSNGKYIKTFTKYTAVLEESDIREFFKITQGNTMRSLVNSVGLITGYAGVAADSYNGGRNFMEGYNVRTMTTLNTENNELKDSEATITYIYRLYFT